jgi:hypothetical protein
MSHFSAYGAYVVFVTIRTHFESPTFDLFTHHKVKASRTTYEKRPDKWFFDKVAKEYEDKELRDFFIANRLKDRNYVTELLEDEAKENYLQYKGRRQALTYHFANDVERVFKYGLDLPFNIVDGEYPYIVCLFLRGSISPESMVILNDFIRYTDKFDKYMGNNDPIWAKVALKLRKYRPFVKYDNNKFKRILKEKIDDNAKKEIV